MTIENYNYRTDPMFLRGKYIGNNEWTMPDIPKCVLTSKDLIDLRFIAYDRVKNGKDTHFNRMVHFFLYDYKFEDIWTNPEKRLDVLRKYRAVLTPDYSIYTQMHPLMQLHNVFRNRWLGAYMADKGIKVVPTVSWGAEPTFEFCFDGIAKGSAVAVSTYMVSEHGNRYDQKDFFLKGYNEMLKRIDPDIILCYNKPFPEMRGNIYYIDYDLSSWKHENDDKGADNSLFQSLLRGWDKYIIKGMGSAYGGKWRPNPNKPEDERLLGKPGEIKETIMPCGKRYSTKIGENGKAIMERHWTDHNRPWLHSNPHDHIISWDPDRGNPIFEKPHINYFDGDAPIFKSSLGVRTNMNIIDHGMNFESISDFKWSMLSGGEVSFVWNHKTYSITHNFEGEIGISEAYKQETEKSYKEPDGVLDYLIDGVPLRNIITKVTVIERSI